MRINEYKMKSEKISGKWRFAVLSDLHGCDASRPLSMLSAESPDLIFAVGDIFERVDESSMKMNKMNEQGFALLEGAASIAPTFYSMGNHEIGGTHKLKNGFSLRGIKAAEWSKGNKKRLEATGVHFLDDAYVLEGGFAIGGLSSGILNEGGAPRTSWLDGFCGEKCPKILLCHHPEYYEKYLTERDIDLVVSGHAHGGQWRFFGRGVFSPGQGLFPKYTSGIYDGHFAVSRGMEEGRPIPPRIFNSAEIMLITVN